MKESPFEATNPDQYSRDLAARINQLLADEKLRKRMGAAGRARAEEIFSWHAIAQQTHDLYASLIKKA